MRSLILMVLIVIPLLPAYAQSTMNPSEHYDTVEIPFNAFNVVRAHPTIITLPHEHDTNFEIEIQNKLAYQNPNGTAVIRIFDGDNKEKFLEIAMGGPPDYRFWIAINTKEDGFFLLHDEKTNGWSPGQVVTITHSSNSGLSASIGSKVIVDSLDVAGFSIKTLAASGMYSPSDPPAASSGSVSFNILSGNPAANPIFYMPFGVLVVVGIMIIILLKTKKRT